ncbi:MAG: hypothetical protein HRU17_13805 [Polyangiaceae bacterium]|nr:hypothetical protein [Polyangiaceae bacterium]
MFTAAWSASAEQRAEPEAPRPPPIRAHHLNYGVGIGIESMADPGDACPSGSTAPCIIGSGLGLTVRLGYRTRGDWYVGGAYESSRQGSSNLLRLGTLQQLRAETRYYASRAYRLQPFAAGAVGVAAYGNEWAVDTVGPIAAIGAGIDFEMSRTSIVGAGISYRPIAFRGWTDGAGVRRSDAFFGFGLSHMIGLEFRLELRSPLARL